MCGLWKRVVGFVMGFCLVAAMTASAAQLGGATAEKSAEPLTMEDIAVLVVAPDLHGLFAGTEALKAKIAPDAPQNFLKNALTGPLGVPVESLVPQGRGMALAWSPKGNQVFAVVEVDPAQAQTSIQTLTAQGVQSALEGNLLIVSHTDAGLISGRNLSKAIVDAQLGAARSPRLNMTLDLRKIITAYEQQINAFLSGLPMLMAMQPSPPGAPITPEMRQSQARILEAEARALYSVCKQMERVVVSLSVDASGIAVKKSIVAAPATNLAELMAAPAVEGPLPGRFLPGSGSIRVEATGNSQAWSKFITSEAELIATQMNVSEEDRKTLLEFFSISMDIYGDRTAMDFMPMGTKDFSGSVITETRDGAKSLAKIEKGAELLQSANVQNFYQGMGVPITGSFQKNARAYKGVSIHKFNMTFDLDKMAPQQAQVMQTLQGIGSYEVAAVGNRIVYAFGQQSMDPIIDAIQANQAAPSTPLAARAAFGDGKELYMDMNFGGYLDLVSGIITPMMPPGQINPLTTIATAIKFSPPVVIAGDTEDGVAVFEARVPTELITSVISAVQSMNAQQ